MYATHRTSPHRRTLQLETGRRRVCEARATSDERRAGSARSERASPRERPRPRPTSRSGAAARRRPSTLVSSRLRTGASASRRRHGKGDRARDVRILPAEGNRVRATLLARHGGLQSVGISRHQRRLQVEEICFVMLSSIPTC